MENPPIAYDVYSVPFSNRKLRGLEKIIGPKNLSTEEQKEWKQITKFVLPFAKEQAKKGEDPSCYLVDAIERSPINIESDVEKILKIYKDNYNATS